MNKKQAKLPVYTSGVIYIGEPLEDYPMAFRTDYLEGLDNKKLISIVNKLCEALKRTQEIYRVRRGK